MNEGDKKGIKWDRVTLNFTNPFTNKHGELISYSVIVANAHRNNPELKEDVSCTWRNAHDQHPSPPYAAIYKCESLFEQDSTCLDYSSSRQRRSAQQEYTYVLITIGDEPCDGKTFCNGQLEPETSYKVFLRAYNEKDEFQDAAAVIVTTGVYVCLCVCVCVSIYYSIKKLYNL